MSSEDAVIGESVADRVTVFTSAITQSECEHIIEIAQPHMKASIVSGEKSGFVSPGRQSSNCWIAHNTTNITRSVCRRIAHTVNMSLDRAEKMQVIYYPQGGEYKPHYDGWDHDNSDKQRRVMKRGGQRLTTALVYLNDVEEGGGTIFPRKNVTVEAKMGNMVVFSNCEENTNKKDDQSLHGGMPVIKGEKWAFNLWFREAPTTKIMYQT